MGRLEPDCLRVRLINSRSSIGQSVTSARNDGPRRPKCHGSCQGTHCWVPKGTAGLRTVPSAPRGTQHSSLVPELTAGPVLPARSRVKNKIKLIQTRSQLSAGLGRVLEMRDVGRDARVREDSSPLKDTGLCCGARQDQSCVPSSDSPCCTTRTRAKVSLCVQRCSCAQELHHQHPQQPPPFRVPGMAGVPGPAGHAMLEVSPALIGSVVWQSNLIEEN